MIHPLACVHPGAKIHETAVIGPFAYIEDNVEIGPRTEVMANASVMWGARIGADCKVFPSAVVGAIPQDQMNLLTDMLGQPRQNANKLGYLSPLHFENEPARHKLLDLIGDFALLGCRIRGKVKACKPGHSGNTECVKKLTEMYSV